MLKSKLALFFQTSCCVHSHGNILAIVLPLGVSLNVLKVAYRPSSKLEQVSSEVRQGENPT